MTSHTETARVLIVDDQARNLDALEAMLEPVECTLTRALTADEALLCLVQHDFAAIVLDIRMPGMDGIELARLIKQRKRSRHIPILFLTAHMADERDALLGYGVGAVDYLSKPVNPEVLRSKIGVFVDLFVKTRALARLNEALRSEVAEREKAQAALQAANEDLEHRVHERTAALMRAHQRLHENQERLRMAMALARIGAWEWHLESGQMTWSVDPEALFGFEAGSFGPAGRLTPVVHPEDRSLVDAATSLASSTGSYEAEYRLVRPDGGIVWITEQGRVVRDRDRPGADDRLIGISRDITADKQAALDRERLLEDARDARDEAERQSRLKDEFLATLSHELRTPMNAILGWLSILGSGKPVRDLNSALAVVRRNAELQAKLIDDLLDMSRLTSGNIQLQVDAVDVAALLHTTVQGLRPAAEAKGVELVADSPEGEVLGDGRRLQQVLWNLAHNAIKFTNSGGRVEIRASRANGHLELAVRDNGRGIGPSFLPHVFERFRQEDASPSGPTAGLGLGLSIAKHLVELHGGTIQAWSPGLGEGSTFVVRIPLAPVHTERSVGAPPARVVPASA